MVCLLACVQAGALAASCTRDATPACISVTDRHRQSVAPHRLSPMVITAQAPSGIVWFAMLAAGVLCTGVAYVVFFR
jgi:hypothetical protein